MKCLLRGDIDLSEMERFKFWTNGEKHLVFLGITKCGKADEGNYRCVLTNRFGNREHKFKLFVSSEYGLRSFISFRVPIGPLPSRFQF